MNIDNKLQIYLSNRECFQNKLFYYLPRLRVCWALEFLITTDLSVYQEMFIFSLPVSVLIDLQLALIKLTDWDDIDRSR